MYKVPHKFVARLRPDPEGDPAGYEAYARLLVLDAVEDYGMNEYSVGSVLTVLYRGDYWVSTYYMQDNRREAEMDAARNGFPYIADENSRPLKVGLQARLYRAIIV